MATAIRKHKAGTLRGRNKTKKLKSRPKLRVTKQIPEPIPPLFPEPIETYHPEHEVRP